MVYIQILLPTALGFALYYLGNNSVNGMADKLRYEDPNRLTAAVALFIATTILVSLVVDDAIYQPIMLALSLSRVLTAFYYWGDLDTTSKAFGYTYVIEGALVAISPLL